MSTSLIFIFASIHSGALASLIGQSPSLNFLKDGGKYFSVNHFGSLFSSVDTFTIDFIGFLIEGWSDLQCKLLSTVIIF